MASETHRELVIAYGGPVRFGFRVVSIERFMYPFACPFWCVQEIWSEPLTWS